MYIRIQCYLCVFILIWFSIVPAVSAAADSVASEEIAGDSSQFAKRSIVVVPVLDGTSDNESQDGAVAIQSALSATTEHHLVSQELVAKATDYDEFKEISEPRLNQASQLLSGAKENYFQFQYQDASAKVGQTIALLKQSTDISMDQKGWLLFDALLTQGIVAKSAKNMELASASFKEAVAMNPTYKMDPKLFPPSVVKMFEAERGALYTMTPGSIEVASDPAAAEVRLNGIACGVTPLTISELPEGEYLVSVTANNYQAVTKNVAVKTSESTKVSEKLKWDKKNNKNKQKEESYQSQVNYGLHVAERLKADKVILVNVDDAGEKGGLITTRMIDKSYHAAHRPIVAKYGQNVDRAGTLAELSASLSEAAGVDLMKDPEKYLDQKGGGDPVLLGGQKSKISRNPYLWGALGAVLVGAIAGGVAASMGGGSSSPSTGSININFK